MKDDPSIGSGQEKEELENTDNPESGEDLEFVESDEEGNLISKKDIEKKLRSDLKICHKEKDEYLTGWQRSKADYINLQKELNQVRSDSRYFAKEEVLNSILPALDSFDMAFGNKEAWEKVDENWRKGIEYIYQQFTKSLEDLNVSKINDVNVDFDPILHEPMNTITTEDKNLDHKIVNIIQAGYKIQDKIIRPARVTVYKFDEK